MHRVAARAAEKNHTIVRLGGGCDSRLSKEEISDLRLTFILSSTHFFRQSTIAKPMKVNLIAPMIMIGLAPAVPCKAEIFTLPDFTRTAGETAFNDVHFNFDPNSGWSGTPPNALANETSLYLKFTVSWAPSANMGTVLVRFNANDNGGPASALGQRALCLP